MTGIIFLLASADLEGSIYKIIITQCPANFVVPSAIQNGYSESIKIFQKFGSARKQKFSQMLMGTDQARSGLSWLLKVVCVLGARGLHSGREAGMSRESGLLLSQTLHVYLGWFKDTEGNFRALLHQPGRQILVTSSEIMSFSSENLQTLELWSFPCLVSGEKASS